MVTMDGTQYQVRVKIGSLGRSFRIGEGDNSSTMLSGLYDRDILGTYYDYEMEVEPDPANPGDYDLFYEAISAPVQSHSVTLPYGQSSITYDAMVTSGNDGLKDKVAGRCRWTGLKVQFTAIRPKRTE